MMDKGFEKQSLINGITCRAYQRWMMDENGKDKRESIVCYVQRIKIESCEWN